MDSVRTELGQRKAIFLPAERADFLYCKEEKIKGILQ